MSEAAGWPFRQAAPQLVAEPGSGALPAGRLAAGPPGGLECNRCGFPVRSKPWGCKNPCANCGTVYPLGDCSD